METCDQFAARGQITGNPFFSENAEKSIVSCKKISFSEAESISNPLGNISQEMKLTADKKLGVETNIAVAQSDGFPC